MKKKTFLIALILSLIIGSCTQETSSPTEGAWELVYVKMGDLEYPGNVTGSQIKMWTKDCFAFTGKFQIDTVSLDNYGWGKYRFIEGNHYEEDVVFMPNAPNMEGETLKMLMEVINDTLVQRWPTDENWNLNEDYNIEKYVRVK
jgi:hypothetical protein